MESNEEQAYYDPDMLEDLEKDAENLESQLEGLTTAEVTSVATTKIVKYVKGAQDEDDLVSGNTHNRWKELIQREEPEVEKPDTSKCCTVQ